MVGLTINVNQRASGDESHNGLKRICLQL